jgi:DNA-binding transcriptional LysR family regulator
VFQKLTSALNERCFGAEAEIGVRLFDRAGKRISLTQEGESFLLDAKRLLTECAQSVQAVQRLSRGESTQLNIGYVANIYHDLLPATLGRFAKHILGHR